jgi:hypothetical protein
LIGNASALKFSGRRAGLEAFSNKEARRKPLAFAADAVQLWDLNGVFLDNGTLKVGLGGLRCITAMATHHTPLEIEGQDLIRGLPSSQ